MLESQTSSQPRRSLGRIVLKNTVAVTIGSVALKAINFLFNVYVVRRLGDDRFGQYSIVLAFVGLFQIFAELGMSQYVMREIARDRSKAPGFFWNLVTLRLLLALAGIVGITLGAVAYGYSSQLVLGIFIFTCTFLLAALLAPLEVILTASERLDYVTAENVVGQLAFALLGGLFLLSGLSFTWLIVASLLSLLPQIGLAFWAARRHRLLSFPIQLDPRSWPGLVRAGLPFGIISLSLSIAFSIDTVMMSRVLPEHVVGWYNVAYGLARSVLFFFGGFSVAMIPTLSRAHIQDPAAVDRWYHRAVKFMLLSSMPIAVGGMVVAFPLIHFLYTDEFLPAAVGLQILIWDVPLLMFTSLCGNMTTIIGDERAAARIYTINALANIILNLYAIPRFGLVGAALVTVVTDLIGAWQFHFLLRHKLHLPNLSWVVLRITLASALMGVAVKLAGDLHIFLLIGLGAVVYGGLVLVLRVLDADERTLIRRLLRPGARPADEAI